MAATKLGGNVVCRNIWRHCKYFVANWDSSGQWSASIEVCACSWVYDFLSVNLNFVLPLIRILCKCLNFVLPLIRSLLLTVPIVYGAKWKVVEEARHDTVFLYRIVFSYLSCHLRSLLTSNFDFERGSFCY